MSMQRWAIPTLAALLLGFSAYFHRDGGLDKVIWSDSEGYYIYLPAMLVYDGFEAVPFVNGCTRAVGPDGVERTFTKYTCGVALMQAPFVAVGHWLAPSLHQPQNGRSAPYSIAILLSAIFYVVAGLMLLKKWLAAWFNQQTVAVTLVALLLATNLFYYTVREAGMSHTYSFFLFSAFLYASQQFRAGKGLWVMVLALSFGLIVLIRPTNGIIALAQLLMGHSVKNELRFWVNRWWVIPVTFSALVLVFIPQMAYWKLTTGHLLWYSYGDEGFALWAQPKIFSVLFSHQNGLFLYTPLMFVVCWGMWLQFQATAAGKWMNPLLLLIATYIFGSWWAWWFGGAFGHRCYVEFYAIMALPLGFAVQRMGQCQRWQKLAAIIVAAFLVLLNIRLSHLYGGMWDGPNWHFANYIDKLMHALFLR